MITAGTGKTHTIANLISHLVGHGKRVLVTSQKEQALAVLRDKIPETIRDLSVAVLGSSAASIAQLDRSVQAIYEHAVALDRAPARNRITGLDAHLSELHRDIGTLRSRISASIARERDNYLLGGATHTPSTLGQWLAANAADLGYIPDEIGPSVSCPLAGPRSRTCTGWQECLILVVISPDGPGSSGTSPKHAQPALKVQTPGNVGVSLRPREWTRSQASVMNTPRN